ncbi:MAG: hypothetical protein ABSG42_04490 [Nitrospirota bacterium]
MAALVLTVACGRKGDIIIPGSVLPGVPADLKAALTSGTVLLAFEMPNKNTKGDPLTNLAGFEITRAEMPGGQEGCQCNFEKVGYVDLDLPAPALVQGKRVVWAENPGALIFGRKYAYKVSAVNKDGFKGVEAGPVVVIFLMPPEAPRGLSVRPGNRVVYLNWSAVTKDEGGTRLDDFAGYNLYRVAGESLPRPVNAVPVKAARYEDSGLKNNETYRYTVAALRGKEPPFTEGPSAGPVGVTPSDKEPPLPPTGLRAVPGEGVVLISWEPNSEPDIAGYNLYRETAGGAPEKLTPAPQTRITYTDSTVSRGATYIYYVTAVDNAVPPNESGPSEKLRITIP